VKEYLLVEEQEEEEEGGENNNRASPDNNSTGVYVFVYLFVCSDRYQPAQSVRVLISLLQVTVQSRAPCTIIFTGRFLRQIKFRPTCDKKRYSACEKNDV